MNKPKLNSTIQTILVTVFSFLFVTMISYATTIGANISTGGTLAVTGTSTFTGLTTLANASTTQLSVSSNLYTALTANSIPYITTSGLLTQDTSNLVWDSTNNRMGIGTSSPYAKLSIHANNGETNTTLFNIASSTASATTSLFTVLNNGNVGVGTDAPSANLNIYQDSPMANQILFQVGTSDYSSRFTVDEDGDVVADGGLRAAVLYSRNNGSASIPTIAFLNDTDTGFFLGGTNILGFTTGGSEAMRIDTNGNVGIGTTTPTASLQVTTATADATTTVELGKANQTKGTCLKLYDATGVAVYCSVTGTGLSCSTTVNCAN